MEIAEIKTKLPITKVLSHYGLQPDRNHRLNCPFHDDKTPSLQVYEKTNTCYCFSTNCKTHGSSIDAIDFIMHKEGCTKHEAILKAKAMINTINTTTETPIDNTRTELLTKLFHYFQNALPNSKPAKDYLSTRHLNHQKTEVGYNSGQFHHGKRKDQNLINACLKYGILLDTGAKSRTGGRAYKPFGKWCIVFPLRDKNHQIISLYFRSTLGSKTDKKQRHFYLKDRQGLYPSYPNLATKKLILTESIIDAATLLEQVAIKKNYTILALYGTNGMTKEHQAAIKNLVDLKVLEEIIFFLNGDAAGKKAVEKYAPILKTDYPKVKISNVSTPENEDVNSLLDGHSAEILTDLIENRKEYEFFLSMEKTTEGTEEVVQRTEKIEKEAIKKVESSLDSTSPHNLKYKGKAAKYQIKGFHQKNIHQLDSLKITLQIITNTKNIIKMKQITVKLDLYEYSQVEKISQLASRKLGISAEGIEADIQELTNLLEAYREAVRTRHALSTKSSTTKIEVPKATITQCLTFLKSNNLINNINSQIGAAGIVGEETNRILLFIIASSYKMPDTLHALIQGSSGSGKTRLLKVISDLMPPEDIKRYTRVTDNSFYNQEEHFFVNKLVCFEDLDGLKEDAQLAVRELQSNDILISSTSIKDKNGSIRGGERIVRGPIASLSCTTKGEIYEDNISRSFLIAVDESRAQTLRIIQYQNNAAAGLIKKTDQQTTKTFLQHCMRLLKPYEVINPYANKIQLPETAHKIRRLNELYQSFVKQITLLHQYQRKTDRQGRLITEKADLQIACDILFESIILKVDELDGSLRQFFERLKKQLKDERQEFTQRDIRQKLSISKAQCSRFINRLQQLEYLTSKYSTNKRKVCYQIDYWDNYAKLRAKIKDNLTMQINEL